MLRLLYSDGPSKIVSTSWPREENESGGNLSLDTIVPGIQPDIRAVQHCLQQAKQTSRARSVSDETSSSTSGQQIYIQTRLIDAISSGTLPECFDSEADARAQACLLDELRGAIRGAEMAQPTQNATAHVVEVESIGVPLTKHLVCPGLVAFCNRQLWICVRGLPSSGTPAALVLLFRTGNVSDDAASVETLLPTPVQPVDTETAPISPPRSLTRPNNIQNRRENLSTTIDTDTEEEERSSPNPTNVRPWAFAQTTAYTHTSQGAPRRYTMAYTPRSCKPSEPSLSSSY